MNLILHQLKTAFLLFIIFTILTGIMYPFIVTEVAQIFFPWQANGSLIQKNNQLIGSLLIGQSFSSEEYFWSRPSATIPFPYYAEHSMGSNLSISNPIFIADVKKRIEMLRKTNNDSSLIPIDLVTASGSGLDPEISPMAAYYQVPRIAKARHISEKQIISLIQSLTQNRVLCILGESRVNVLLLNLALDQWHANLLPKKNKGKSI